jgi:hypothetical protein
MAKLPKLDTMVNPSWDLYKELVHAYYHLLQGERATRALLGISHLGGTSEQVYYWQGLENMHYSAYEAIIENLGNWHEYLSARQEEHMERRATVMFVERDAPKKPMFREFKRDRSTAARRRRKARYN